MNLSESISAELIQFRRTLHREPELSGQEEMTAKRVVEGLQDIDLSIQTAVAGHGVVVELRGKQDGPTLAYRADMDALPIQETSDIPYQSAHPGVMHACGHDVHTTIALGIARQLATQRDVLHGNVRFIFQPSEEACGLGDEPVGAEAMAQEGVLDQVNAIFALHCMPSLHVGTFGYCNHAVWASSDNLYITLQGKEAHGAYPHEGVDAIQMAASLIPSLLSIPAKIVDTQNPCTLTIGTLEAGTAHNIVAGKAALTGTLRTLDEESRKTALTQIERLVERTATAFGGSGTFVHQVGAKAVVNDAQLQAQLVNILSHQAGPSNVLLTRSQMGAEDFSAFSRSVPGCYLLLGTGNPEKGIVHPIHTPQFNVDEDCIPFAVSHMSEALLKIGKQWKNR